MTESDAVAAEPGPTAEPTPAPAPAPDLLPLAEAYPACFDLERPRPLKLGIHKDLLAAGFAGGATLVAALKRALGRYCRRPRYWKVLRAGAARIDLQGQPAGAVTAEEAATARADIAAWNARKAGLPVPPRPRRVAPSSQDALPPGDTPVPKEYLAPGRLELAAKFSELPRSRPVQGGVEIGVPAGEWAVTAILPAKVWRKLARAAEDYPQWVAALSGSPERFADGEITLQHPTVQVFEKKARPEAEPARSVEVAPPEPPEANAAEAEAPAAPASNPGIARAAASRKGRRKP